MLQILTEYIYRYTPFFVWTDVLELFLCIGVIYGLARWFAYDTSKPLLLYFYGYLALAIGAYWIPLPMIYAVLAAAWPCALVIAILIHQKILQKNFIGLNFRAAHSIVQHDWIKELVRFSTQQASASKSSAWIIQKDQDIRALCQHQLVIKAPITYDLLTILAEGSTITFDKPLLIDTTGTLLSANVTIRDTQHQGSSWVGCMVELTQTNNVIVCSTNTTGLFDLFYHGKVIQNVPAQAMIGYIKKYCLHAETPVGKELYENPVSVQKKHP